MSLAEGIYATTPAGKLQMHILAAIAEFETAPIVERVRAGPARRAAQGKPLGRPRQSISEDDLARTLSLSTPKAAGPSRRLARRRPPRSSCLKPLRGAPNRDTARSNNPSPRSLHFRPRSAAETKGRSGGHRTDVSAERSGSA